MDKLDVTVDSACQLQSRLCLDGSKLRQSVRVLKAVEKTWHVILWTCVVSIGAVLLFIEMISGVTIPSVIAIVGFLTLIAFDDYSIRRNEAEAVPTFVTPLPIVTGRNFTSFAPQSSKFSDANRLNFNCFTKDETEFWLKNEPNFKKRIVTGLESDFTKHKRYRTILRFLRKLECLVLER